MHVGYFMSLSNKTIVIDLDTGLLLSELIIRREIKVHGFINLVAAKANQQLRYTVKKHKPFYTHSEYTPCQKISAKTSHIIPCIQLTFTNLPLK